MQAQAPQIKASAGSTLVTLAAFVIVVAGMRAAQDMMVPFLLSLFIAVISAPALFWLEEHGLPRLIAMLVVVGTIIATAVALSAFLGTSMRRFTRELPVYKERLNSLASGALDFLRGKGLDFEQSDILALLEPGAAIQIVGDIFNSFGGVLTNAFLIGMTVVFMLFETATFPDKMRAIVRDPERSMRRFSLFTTNLRRYLAIKTMTSLGTGVAVSSWLWLIGVDYAVLWGLLAFMLNYVPNIGSIIAAVPAVLLALVQLGPEAALLSAGGYLFVNVVFGNIVEPRFMGRGLGLSTLVVFLSLIFWGWVLGPVGMFLSVPLTMSVKIALDSREDTHWLSVMLGSVKDANEELVQDGLTTAEPTRTEPADVEPAAQVPN